MSNNFLIPDKTNCLWSRRNSSINFCWCKFMPLYL